MERTKRKTKELRRKPPRANTNKTSPLRSTSPPAPPAHVAQAHRAPTLRSIINRAHFPRAALVRRPPPRSGQGFHFKSDIGGGILQIL